MPGDSHLTFNSIADYICFKQSGHLRACYEYYNDCR
jgi:hypothetical protein